MNALALMLQARKVSQRSIAKSLGITESAVSQQLKNGIRSMRTARKYAVVLECNPYLLLD